MKKNFIAQTIDFNTIAHHKSAPIFRKVFEMKKFDLASISICSAGFYRLFLNGKEITKGLFAPYVSNPDHNLYVDEYDVTAFLVNGKNLINVILGNGFNNSNDNGIWNNEQASFRSSPKFSLQIFVDGNIFLVSDATFKVTDYAITFDDLRCGEHFDARKLDKNYFDIEYNDFGWDNAISVIAPKGELRKCDFEPIKVVDEINFQSYFRNELGYIFDFGQVNAGIFKLKICGKVGQKLKLTFGEIINDNNLDLSNISFGDRSVKNYIQSDEYILCDGYQEYSPSFTFHGYRYALIEGLKESQINDDLITLLVCHSALNKKGDFCCSDTIVNKIQDCVLRSDLSNFFYFPLDCPQREKNGWTADASLSCEQILYNFDAYKSLKEWLTNIRKAQTKEGVLPCIVPTAGWGYDWGNGPAWDSVLIELPYQLYKFYGKKEVLQGNILSILRYFRYLTTKVNDDGLIGFGLGDWCEAGTFSEELYTTSVEITDTLVTIDLLHKGAYICECLGLLDDMNYCRNFERRLIDSYLDKYYINEKLMVTTQTSLALTIKSGILPYEKNVKLFDELLRQIAIKDNHFCVGVIGAKVLFDVLCDFGQSRLAYELITKDTFPSYAYHINLGATTLFEGFHKMDTYNNNFRRLDGGSKLLSLNHHFWGSVSAWFYKYIAGIKIESYKNIIVSPEFMLSLNTCDAEYYFDPDSFIKVRWTKSATINLKIISQNIKCKVLLKDNFRYNDLSTFDHSGDKEYIVLNSCE